MARISWALQSWFLPTYKSWDDPPSSEEEVKSNIRTKHSKSAFSNMTHNFTRRLKFNGELVRANFHTNANHPGLNFAASLRDHDS